MTHFCGERARPIVVRAAAPFDLPCGARRRFDGRALIDVVLLAACRRQRPYVPRASLRLVTPGHEQQGPQAIYKGFSVFADAKFDHLNRPCSAADPSSAHLLETTTGWA